VSLRKLVLRQFQSPGDIVMLTAAVRDLHRAYPGLFLTDVRTSCPELWEHNPYLTPLDDQAPDVESIECHYPLIHDSNRLPYHFIHGFMQYLNEQLALAIRPTQFRGDIHLSDAERSWCSQVCERTGEEIPFWLIVAGGKYDFTAKWWSPARLQAVVDHFRGRILFVQIGEDGHHHPPLRGVLNMVGLTDLRQLVRLVYHAQGVVTPVSLLMHLAAAVEVRDGVPRNRPCVVIAGGREPPHWEAYPHHQFVHTNGALLCCDDGGCWRSRVVPLGDGDEQDHPQNLCVDPIGTLPRCLDMLRVDDITRRIEMYFEGGALCYLRPDEAELAERAIGGHAAGALTPRHNAATGESDDAVVRRHPAAMFTRPVRLRTWVAERGEVTRLRGENILLYWPHGFGDWVQLSYVLPLFERSNRYWITRFGDDNSTVMDGNRYVTPVLLGSNSAHCDDGGDFGNRHFGLEHHAIVDGNAATLDLPLALADECRRHHIGHVVWSVFEEPVGMVEYPFHSKARSFLRAFAGPAALHQTDLSRPLPSSISFTVPPFVTSWVEARLRNGTGFSGHRRLCIVGRNGYTSVGKNWGHQWREDLPASNRREGAECVDFMRIMRDQDPRWLFVVMEDRLFGGDDTVCVPELHAWSYASLFGTPETGALPFALVLKVLMNFADLCVGVPSGPYHLAMAKPGLPTVGIWIEHLPSWYDEPKAASRHVISRNIRDAGLDCLPGSFFRKDGLEFRALRVDSRIITGEQVAAAAGDVV
jgi:ADP-heptose:LPS heptosyltransferase